MSNKWGPKATPQTIRMFTALLAKQSKKGRSHNISASPLQYSALRAEPPPQQRAAAGQRLRKSLHDEVISPVTNCVSRRGRDVSMNREDEDHCEASCSETGASQCRAAFPTGDGPFREAFAAPSSRRPLPHPRRPPAPACHAAGRSRLQRGEWEGRCKLLAAGAVGDGCRSGAEGDRCLFIEAARAVCDACRRCIISLISGMEGMGRTTRKDSSGKYQPTETKSTSAKQLNVKPL